MPFRAPQPTSRPGPASPRCTSVVAKPFASWSHPPFPQADPRPGLPCPEPEADILILEGRENNRIDFFVKSETQENTAGWPATSNREPAQQGGSLAANSKK